MRDCDGAVEGIARGADDGRQLVHSVTLLVARGNTIASLLFIVGMTLFSGSIYALVLDPVEFKWIGPVTPMGGACLVFGWLALVFSKNRVYRRL